MTSTNSQKSLSSLSVAAWLVVFVLLAVFPLLPEPIGGKFHTELLAKVMIMSIFAASLQLLVGYTGLVSLGHAAFFGFGAYAVAMLAFGVRIEGSVAGFAAVLVTFALLTASFGLLVAALGRTPEATRGLAILATLLLVMLGGAWVPSFIFPAWLQTASLYVPTRWAIDGLDAMTWRRLPLQAALMPVVVMLGFTAAFFTIALARFRWEE
jgi:ABC-type branched-subunit amino acid transport system permease subunit